MGAYIYPDQAGLGGESRRLKEPLMQNEPPNNNSIFSRFLRPSLRQRRLIAMSSAAAIVVVGLGAFALSPPVRHVQVAETQPVMMLAANDSGHSTPRMLENTAPFSFADLVERVSPAVVTITSETVSTENDGDDAENLPAPFRDFFNQFGQGQRVQPHKAISAGSGFIIDKAGFIVTNNHVIDASKKITVKLPDGRSFTAKLVGTDPSTDIALLKISSDKPLPTVEFGNDKQLRVGDWVRSACPTRSPPGSSPRSAATSKAASNIPTSSRSTRPSIAAIRADPPSICAGR
jgi:small nuclear ribonucleoprotein (snRNP)-like protein